MNRLKRVAWLLLLGACLVFLASCGGDNTTNFVLSSASPSPSPSSSGSPSASASPSSDASSPPATEATPIPSGLRIIIDSPDGGSTITSPVEVTGTASVTNGEVLVLVKDAAGREVGRATGRASAARPEFGHYDVGVNFTTVSPGTKGEIRVLDAATQKNYYFITIRFG